MEKQAAEVRTTCPYCGVGCGVLAKVAADGTVSVRGDPDHPANFGKLCSKGSALGETMGLDGRLLYPEIGRVHAGWDEALDLVAGKFSRAIAEHGPDSVAFYISGQLLTEDYYVANKLMKGFRFGQHRHQFAAVHGLVGGRPSPRLRRRHRAWRVR